eukprot:g5934.t1
MAAAGTEQFAAVKEQVETEIRTQVKKFLNETLPAIKIPDVASEAEPLKFAVRELQISDQEIAEDDITIEFGDLSDLGAGEVLKVTVGNVTARLAKLKWMFELTAFPFAFGDGLGDVTLTGGEIVIGFKIEKVESGSLFSGLGGGGGEGAELVVSSSAVSVEVLSLDVSDTWFSGLYNGVLWLVEGKIKDAVLEGLNGQLEGNIAEALRPINDDERVRQALAMLLQGLEKGVRRASQAAALDPGALQALQSC